MSTTRALLLATAALVLVACKEDGKTGTTSSAELTTDAQKFGYTVGVDVATSLEPIKGEVDVKAFEQGFEETLKGIKPKLDDAAREEIKQAAIKKIQEKQQKDMAEKGKKAQEEGDKFLAENGKKTGVKTTASGLQYQVLTEGTGAQPKAEDTVKVHYKGTLLNGETFDSSYERKEPVTFPLQNVIPGWTEGVQLMKVGSKFKFFIPAKLAYGERGGGPKIGPNSTLVFEVELLGIEGAAKVEAPATPAVKEVKPK
jgi:FKBP-type peptidyl-prolyl cis-trans isomerase FkpA/FKBP-type peptidyl-prolyl cis-trans isomerase FklB